MAKHHSEISLSEVHQSVDTTVANIPRWKKILSFFGPAYLVSVGYMDPGNWATDLAGGSRFGYSLLWVLLMSNLMALVLQNLSARLGIVRRKDLAQINRETYPRAVNFILYLLAEIAIAATDLAEVLGMAIGIQLLFGVPLIYGVLLTAFDTFLLMLLQRLGIRKLEAFIVGLIFIIGMSFLIQIIVASPAPGEVVKGFVPHIENDTALYIAIGIIGATVMPHNLYLHSALVQTRKIGDDEKSVKRALWLNFLDSGIALNMAFLVNAAILILAATVFFKTGRTDVAEIKQAYELLPHQLGSAFAAKLFAFALICAGQSSTITGTLAGQIVMEGYLRLRINPIVRRLITRLLAIIPAVLIILINGEKEVDQLLIFSQVVLSLQLGFAVIPLIHFVSDKKAMGRFVIHPLIKILAWIIAAALIYLNVKMLTDQVTGYFTVSDNVLWKSLITITGLFFAFLLLYTILFPLLQRRRRAVTSPIHADPVQLDLPEQLAYQHIAVTLDFGPGDNTILAHALAQGGTKSVYTLIHVVESVSAHFNYKSTADIEAQTDTAFLENYAAQLSAKGYAVNTQIGYGNVAPEIKRIVAENRADLLVMGAHGHRGIKDIIFGQTINHVRHLVKIPVLIVNT